MKINWVGALIAALFVVSFCIRFFPLENIHYWDESVYLQASEVLLGHRDFNSELYYRPPVISLIFAVGKTVWNSDYSAQFLVALINSMGVIALFYLGKRLWGFRVGLLAAIFMAFSPFVIENSHTLLTDVPSLAFSIFCILFLLEARKRHSYMVMAGVFFSLTVLTKFTGAFLVLLIVPILFIYKRFGLKWYFSFGVGAFIILLPYFIYNQIKYRFFLYTFILSKQIIEGSPFVAHFFYFTSLPAVFTIFEIVGLGLFLVLCLPRIRKWSKVNWLLGLMLGWSVLFIIYISTISHKETRYLLPILFCVYLVSAQGYSKFVSILKGSISIQRILFLLVVVAFGIVAFASINRPFLFFNNAASETLEISKFICENLPVNSSLYAITNFPVFSYYSGCPVNGVLPSKIKLNCTPQSFKAYNIGNHGFFIAMPGNDAPFTSGKTFYDDCYMFKKVFGLNTGGVYAFDTNGKSCVEPLPFLGKKPVMLRIENIESGNYSLLQQLVSYLNQNDMCFDVSTIPFILNQSGRKSELKQLLNQSCYSVSQLGFMHHKFVNGKYTSEFEGSSQAEIRDALLKSRALIKEILGKDVKTFIPPHYAKINSIEPVLLGMGYGVYSTSRWDSTTLEQLPRVYYNLIFNPGETTKQLLNDFSLVDSEPYLLVSVNLNSAGSIEGLEGFLSGLEKSSFEFVTSEQYAQGLELMKAINDKDLSRNSSLLEISDSISPVNIGLKFKQTCRVSGSLFDKFDKLRYFNVNSKEIQVCTTPFTTCVTLKPDEQLVFGRQ